MLKKISGKKSTSENEVDGNNNQLKDKIQQTIDNQTNFENAIKAYNTSFENAIKKAKQTKDAIPILRMFSVSEKLKDGSMKKRPAKELIDTLEKNTYIVNSL